MLPLLLIPVEVKKKHLQFLNNYVNYKLAKFDQNQMIGTR